MRRLITAIGLVLATCAWVYAGEPAVEFGGFSSMPHAGGLVMENVPPEYRTPLWAKTKSAYLKAVEKWFAELDAFGVKMNRLYFHYNNNPTYNYRGGELAREFTAVAFRHGVRLSPILNIGCCGGHWRKFGITDTQPYLMQLFPSGRRLRNSFCRYCPNNPTGRKVMRDYVATVTGYLKGAPGFDLLSLDDEYGFGGVWIEGDTNCYCEACRAVFKKQTGVDPPDLFGPPPGQVLELNDPSYLWTQTIGVGWYPWPSMARYNDDMIRAAKQVKPDVEVCQWPGFGGNLDRILWELYGQDGLGADLQIHKVRSFRGCVGRPLAMYIGWLTRDWTKTTPDEQVAQRVRINTLVCLVHQVREIGLAPTGCLWEYPAIRREAKFLGELIATHGALFRSLKRRRKPVAMLDSRITKAFQSLMARRYYDCWRYGKNLGPAWRGLRRSHIPLELVTEQNIRDGCLDRYRALVVVNWEYTTTDVWDKVKAFAASKPVFHDKSTPLRVPGSRLLDVRDVKTVHHTLVKHVPSLPVEIASHDVFYELLQGKGRQVLCILNPCAKAVTTPVTLNVPAAKVVDLFTNKAQPINKKRTFTVQIEPNHWRVFCVSPP